MNNRKNADEESVCLVQYFPPVKRPHSPSLDMGGEVQEKRKIVM